MRKPGEKPGTSTLPVPRFIGGIIVDETSFYKRKIHFYLNWTILMFNSERHCLIRNSSLIFELPAGCREVVAG